MYKGSNEAKTIDPNIYRHYSHHSKSQYYFNINIIIVCRYVYRYIMALPLPCVRLFMSVWNKKLILSPLF